MVSTKKSFGNVTLAGIFAAATLAAAVPAFASTTTITWDFFGGAQGNSDVGPSATFTGTENPTASLSSPLSSDLGITAYGEVVKTTVKDQATTYGSASPRDLFNKFDGGTENGLGLNNYLDSEIGDTNPNTSKDTTTYGTGMIQLDISHLLTLLGYANNKNASLTIGSLQSADTAVISGSNSLGVIGTQIGQPVGSASSGNDQSETFTLQQLTGYSYLNVTVAAPGQTVLLSTVVLSLPSNSGNPTPAAPAPVPASAGLTLVGALGMGLVLLARRRLSM